MVLCLLAFQDLQARHVIIVLLRMRDSAVFFFSFMYLPLGYSKFYLSLGTKYDVS